MKIMVIDGNSILNRAFYGIRQLTNHEGLPTNAVYGFLATLFKLQDEEQPDRTIVCFDVKEKTFRHLKFDTYKATRKGMPDELAAQLPITKQVLDALMLDDATAAKFTPVYQAYQKEMRECRLPRLKKKSNEMTDEEIAQEIERQFTQGRKVIDVKEKYYKEFKKILTMKQIREVYRLERFNMRRMGKEINRRQGMKPHPMPGMPFGKEMQKK